MQPRQLQMIKYEIDATLAVQQARYNVKQTPKRHNTAAELEHQSRTGTAEGQKKATAELTPLTSTKIHQRTFSF
jgi:hypothetical protein